MLRFALQATRMGVVARRKAAKTTLPVLAMWVGADQVAIGGLLPLRKEFNSFMRDELTGGNSSKYNPPVGQYFLTEGNTKKDALTAITSWLNKQ